MRTAVCAIILSAASMAGGATDAELFNAFLKYSQEVAAKHHLIVRAEFEPESGKGKPVEFRYDRYPEIERMQLPNGASYVRKKDGKWMKSEDWRKTGEPAAKSVTKDFESWIALVEAPLQNVVETKDAAQGALRPTRVENDEDAKPNEIRFIMSRENPTGLGYPRFAFVQFHDQALLRFFGGVMRLGEQRVIASIGYDFMFLVDMKIVTPTPSPR